jgi:hypothetical protein
MVPRDVLPLFSNFNGLTVGWGIKWGIDSFTFFLGFPQPFEREENSKWKYSKH